MQNNKFRFILNPVLYVLLVFSFCSISCDSGDPEILTTNATSVFDFKDNKSSAQAHLSIFLSMNNQLQRTEAIEVFYKDKGYTWKISEPQLFESDGKKWAGSCNIRFPQGKSIENGLYIITYTDLGGNEVQTTANVAFDKKLLSCKASEVKKYIKEPVTENTALYDENDNLIYFGKKKNQWNNDSDILKDYKNAVSVRECYSSANSSVLCMMPVRKIKEQK